MTISLLVIKLRLNLILRLIVTLKIKYILEIYV